VTEASNKETDVPLGTQQMVGCPFHAPPGNKEKKLQQKKIYKK
jgi:hypothetical protein